MPTAIHEKIRLADSGRLPQAILKLQSGWVIAGDRQPLQGYCMLLADPVATDFNALNEPRRAQYAMDMGRVGDGLKKILGSYRINYETWGNLAPALHTHIVPRYAHEPDDLRVKTPRQAYDWDAGRPFDLTQDETWLNKLREFLAPFAAT